MLRLTIHGRFRAKDQLGSEIPIKSKKGRALLAYLALPPGKHRSREELMTLLWSDRSDEQARGSLRQVLSALRRSLGEIGGDVLRITDETVSLNPEKVVVEPASAGGVLLEGLRINDPAFEEWLRDERLRQEELNLSESDSDTPHGAPKASLGIDLRDQSPVRYVLSDDGISIAHADVGTGYPIVFAGSWMTHLEKDWENPLARQFLKHLAQDYKVIRYDQRGIGMSDWEGVSFSLDDVVNDMAHVIDEYNYEKVAIFGGSQGAVTSIAYAARYPDRVSHLILHGGYARGRRRRNSIDAKAESEALTTLIRQGWASRNPAFRQTLTSLFMPEATAEEAKWFNDFQMTSSTAEIMGNVRAFFDDIDVSEMLKDIAAPTLVVHCANDSIAPVSEGKYMASRIKNCTFVLLNSDNHMISEGDPDFKLFLSSFRDFLAAGT